ncbi:MAG: tetratricopeptide repeat protein [Desulfobacter sp.]|nr:MAG: tetratricopeptide repeat protein [Desulfobacter sp.]
MGHVYLWTHQHDKGIAQIRKAISLEPGNAKWLASLGEQLTWAGRPQEGIKSLEQAMRLDPKYPAWYLWNLGHAYYLSQEYEKAADIFQQALVKDPYFWPVHAYLGLTYDLLGDSQKARQETLAAARAIYEKSPGTWETRLPYKDRVLASKIIEKMTELGLD